MGTSLSWLAVSGCDRATALEALGFELAGAEDDEPVGVLSVTALPGGWLLFVASRDLDVLFKPGFVALSQHGDAVGCAIEEHVMFAEARGFSGGVETWRVTRDSESDADDVEIRGKPPAALAAILAAAISAQEEAGGDDAGVDMIFDVPIDLAKSLCGFRYDDEWPDDLTFAEVRRPRAAAAASGPNIFQRLFGRR